MAAPNTNQIMSRVGVVGWGVITSANTAVDGTGTLDAAGTATSTTGHLATIFTADATNGGRVSGLRFMALGTNSAATVARIFINNGSANGTAMNNVLIAEIALPITAASNTTNINNASATYDLPNSVDGNSFPLVLPPGYKLMACLGTAAAGGWAITAFGGAY